MGYIVTFTKDIIPSDDNQAWEYLQELIEKEEDTEEQSAEFLDLIEKLKEKFPCICDLPDDQVDEGVWSDGPLSNNAGLQLTTLGIVSSAVEEVLPFLIESARDYKLVLFDHQTDMIYRPGKLEFRKYITDAKTGAIVSEEIIEDKSQIRAKLVQMINNTRDGLSQQKSTLVIYCVCFAAIQLLAYGLILELLKNKQFLIGTALFVISILIVVYFYRLVKRMNEKMKKSKELMVLLKSKL